MPKPTKNRIFDVNAFIEFYYKNIHLYPDHRNDTTLGVVEPYTGRNTGKYTLYGYVKKYFGNGSYHFPDREVTCLECRETHNISFFCKEYHCPSRKCRVNVNWLLTKQRKEKEKRNTKRWQERDPTFDYICKITGKIFNILPKSTRFIHHLLKNSISFVEYIHLYEKDKLRYCHYCNTVIPPNGASPNFPYQKEKEFMFCNHSHYVEYRRANPGSIQPPESEESRERRSILLKQRIKDGIFTPRNNHWKNWIVRLPDGIKYRSRWEWAFHLENPTFEYESIRIPYKINGKDRIYIIDFYDPYQKICYEIKPSTEIDKEINVLKFEQAMKYCSKNQMSFRIITEYDILACLQNTQEEQLCQLRKDLTRQISKRVK